MSTSAPLPRATMRQPREGWHGRADAIAEQLGMVVTKAAGGRRALDWSGRYRGQPPRPEDALVGLYTSYEDLCRVLVAFTR